MSARILFFKIRVTVFFLLAGGPSVHRSSPKRESERRLSLLEGEVRESAEVARALRASIEDLTAVIMGENRDGCRPRNPYYFVPGCESNLVGVQRPLVGLRSSDCSNAIVPSAILLTANARPCQPLLHDAANLQLAARYDAVMARLGYHRMQQDRDFSELSELLAKRFFR